MRKHRLVVGRTVIGRPGSSVWALTLVADVPATRCASLACHASNPNSNRRRLPWHGTYRDWSAVFGSRRVAFDSRVRRRLTGRCLRCTWRINVGRLVARRASRLGVSLQGARDPIAAKFDLFWPSGRLRAARAARDESDAGLGTALTRNRICIHRPPWLAHTG